MNKQRAKSIGILATVLLTGLILGLLIPGTFHRFKGKPHPRTGKSQRDDHRGGADWFVHRVRQVIDADSSQVKEIDSVASWANERLNTIGRRANEQSLQVLDSAVDKLNPILREDQQQRLHEFREQIATRAKEHIRHR